MGMGYLERALEDFERYNDLSQQGGDLSSIARSLSSMGTVLVGLGRLKDARRYFDEALQNAVTGGDLQMEALARMLLGQALTDLDQLDQAVEELLRGPRQRSAEPFIARLRRSSEGLRIRIRFVRFMEVDRESCVRSQALGADGADRPSPVGSRFGRWVAREGTLPQQGS